MPSDFVRRGGQRKTLADLIRELNDPQGSRPAHATSPLAGSGRLRNARPRRVTNQETELERQRRAAQQALRTLQQR